MLNGRMTVAGGYRAAVGVDANGLHLKNHKKSVMSFENLLIDRIIIHDVFAQRADEALVLPVYGAQLLLHDPIGTLRDSITNALGKTFSCVEMTTRMVSAVHGRSVEWTSRE